MKELFTAYGEVPANVNFLGYGSEKQDSEVQANLISVTCGTWQGRKGS